MKEYMNKRAASGIGFSRRGSNLAFREDPNHEDGSIKCCNRLGCSTRFYSMRGTQISNLEKAKYPKASFRSMSSNTLAGSSSKSISAASDCRKPHQERQNRTSLQEIAKVESSNSHGGIIDSEANSRQGEIVLPDAEDFESTILNGLSENVTETLENYHTKPSLRTQKQIIRQWESGNRDTSSSSSTRHSVASRNASQTNKHASQGAGSGAQRHGIKNVNCAMTSDVPSGCSSSDSDRNRRAGVVTKRSSDGAGSSTRSGKSMSASSNGGYTGSRHRDLLAQSLSLPQQAARRTRNRPTSRAGAIIARTPRGPNGETRIRLSEQEDNSSRSLSVPIGTSELPQTHFSISEAAPESSSRSFLVEFPSMSHNTFGRQVSSSRSARTRPIPYSENINTTMFHSPLGDRDDYRHLNLEGISEVLLALERIGQNEQLTYEQLLALEANFSFGLGFYDQHRGMRLDIDNMSYEELLALEEKMGTVSTALTEEALSRCLKRSIYAPVSSAPGIAGCRDDDTKCSVCQEEYVGGDEVGKLACEHRYHVDCIDEWLRQKNWCPICKASVVCPS